MSPTATAVVKGRVAEPSTAEQPHAALALVWCYKSSVVIAALLVVAATGGLFFDVYRDNLWVSSQLRGQDFVSILVGFPLLVVSLLFAVRGSTRAQLVWLGALGYVTYSYGYIFGIAWNELFLVYLVLVSLSAFTLARALISLDVVAIAARFSGKTPVRLVSRYMTFFGVGLGALWGLQAMAATFTGDIPRSVVDSGHPTGVVFILDLGLVVPLFLIGAHLLRRRNAWGYVAAGILLVKGIAEGLALVGMALFMYIDDYPDIEVGLIPLWAFAAAASLALSIRYFGSMTPRSRD